MRRGVKYLDRGSRLLAAGESSAFFDRISVNITGALAKFSR
jgi:hypothetical protein